MKSTIFKNLSEHFLFDEFRPSFKRSVEQSRRHNRLNWSDHADMSRDIRPIIEIGTEKT